MDERDKTILGRNLEYIAKALASSGKARDVVYELRECQVLSAEDADKLLGLESTQTNMVRHLVVLLIKGKEKTLQVFLKVLMQFNLSEMVKQIDREYYQQHEGTIRGSSDEFKNLQRLPHFPSGGAEALPFLRRPRQERPPSRPGSVGYDSCEENNNPDEPLRIVVTESREVGGAHLDESELYRNLSKPRGLVFLANFKDFRDNSHPCRRGSEIDVKNLSLLFTQMGYKIPKQHINMTKYETIKALREFRSNEELASVDSCIVIVMSHGRDEKSFYTSDNQFLSVNEVVERFSNRECPALKGKPKIFIFQYCRGGTPDVGVAAGPQLVSNVRRQGLETDASFTSEAIVEKDPTYTDMYIAYSTVEGFVSFRHPERGSWLMEALCQVFMKHAHKLELESLMKMVSRRVRQNYSDDGSKQVCEFVQRAFDRHFYFNPQRPDNVNTLSMQQLSDVLSDTMGAASLKPCSMKPAALSRGSTPEPPFLNPHELNRIRQRNWSGASNGSDRSVDEMEPYPWSHERVLLHPRIRRLSGNRRRSLPPDPKDITPSQLLFHEAWNRSFSEQAQGSRGTTPDPSESQENIFTEDQEIMAVPECPPFITESPHFDTVDCPRENPDLNDSQNGDAEVAMNQDDEAGSLLHTSKSCDAVIEKSQLQEENEEGFVCESRHSIKRQLSFPSTNETLSKINDVKKFLQVYDSDPSLIHPLQRIESFVNKKKYEGKRRKKGQESSSLEY
ncbi:caspase-1-like isoform X2 [Penaeus japonicus]|uniref:caspase-1-like isoform X2 n=1 Tax=Penaeus japonicus TaxID=27405 RepID=UPI001C70F3BD|nr:caspase-1-like isoform X2 [Penaeus japonicus]